MKKLIYGIYALFIFLMAITFFLAHRYSDDLVEKGYYEKSVSYFSEKEAEEEKGIRVTLPGEVDARTGLVVLSISQNGVPAEGVRGRLVVHSVAARKVVAESPLTRAGKGKVKAQLGKLPEGRYLATADLEKGGVRWTERWLFEAR